MLKWADPQLILMTQMEPVDRSILFNYWRELPVIKTIPSEQFETMVDHPLRNAMAVVLRKGFIDDETGQRRHAMSLKEMVRPITDYLKDKDPDSKEPGLTTLYHHRDIMMELGLVKEVATFLEGKRHVTYYGRTARAYIVNAQGHHKLAEVKSQLRDIILYLNPDTDRTDLDPYLDKLIEDRLALHQQILDWIIEHEQMLTDLDLDAIDLYQLISSITVIDQSGSDRMAQLQQYLDLQ